MDGWMTWLDVSVIAIIALSAVFGIFRGFVKEMLSLAVWVLSFWVASRYSPLLASHWEGAISYPNLRAALAFVALLLVVLVAGFLVTAAVVRLVRASAVSGPDRALGGVFGLLRGVVIVTIVVMAAAWTPLGRGQAWDDSRLAGHFRTLAAWASGQLAAGIGRHIPAPVGADKIG
jgi:membrane protein required for colicin V production